jgi:hypothetical protein
MLLGSDKILYQNSWLVSVQINGVKELFLLIWYQWGKGGGFWVFFSYAGTVASSLIHVVEILGSCFLSWYCLGLWGLLLSVEYGGRPNTRTTPLCQVGWSCVDCYCYVCALLWLPLGFAFPKLTLGTPVPVVPVRWEPEGRTLCLLCLTSFGLACCCTLFLKLLTPFLLNCCVVICCLFWICAYWWALWLVCSILLLFWLGSKLVTVNSL